MVGSLDRAQKPTRMQQNDGGDPRGAKTGTTHFANQT